MKYSVLMSVYYKEKPEWFNQSIKSIINQTVQTNDFVIVKDGQLTKDLDEIISRYCEQYPDIINVIEIGQNVGLGPALAIGVTKCKNEWIVRMDSDDYCLSNRCEEQFRVLNINPELDMIGTNVDEFIDSIDNVVAKVVLPENSDDIKKFARKRNPFRHSAMLLRKSKILQAGNYKSYYLCEDYDMWIRMIECGANAYNIQKNLVYMRINKDFYKRRGGVKYLKSILKFKKEQYEKGFYSAKDYIITTSGSIIVCLMPNFMRYAFYKKFLRK